MGQENSWTLDTYYAMVQNVSNDSNGDGEMTDADTYGINTITYNPELDSMTQRLNATKIYEGKPHIKDDPSTPDVNEGNYTWWPHLLIEQLEEVDKKKKRLVVELSHEED